MWSVLSVNLFFFHFIENPTTTIYFQKLQIWKNFNQIYHEPMSRKSRSSPLHYKGNVDRVHVRSKMKPRQRHCTMGITQNGHHCHHDPLPRACWLDGTYWYFPQWVAELVTVCRQTGCVQQIWPCRSTIYGFIGSKNYIKDGSYFWAII